MKNHVIYGDEATLVRLREEYEFVGRPCEIQGDKLVVFAIPPKKVQPKGGNRGRRRGR